MEKFGKFPSKETAEILSVSLGAVLQKLIESPEEAMASPREYLLERNITPENLQQMGELKFEVLIAASDKNDSLLLRTGSKTSTQPKYPAPLWPFSKSAKNALKGRAEAFVHQWSQNDRASLLLHNHPGGLLGSYHRPSYGDQKVSSRGKRILDILVTKKGVLLYDAERSIDIPWDRSAEIESICDILNGKSDIDETLGKFIR